MSGRCKQSLHYTSHFICQSIILQETADLGERLLVVIFEVLRIDIQMIVVGCERLRALGNTGNKLLHLQQNTIARPITFKRPHWDVGWSDTVQPTERRKFKFKWLIHGTQGGHTQSGNQGRKYHQKRCALGQGYINKYFEDLLAISGGTLSMVTSRLPKMTGNLAIFSGLWIQF